MNAQTAEHAAVSFVSLSATDFTYAGGNTLHGYHEDSHNLTNPYLPNWIEGRVKSTSPNTAMEIDVSVDFFEEDDSKISTLDDSTTNRSPGEVWRFQIDMPEGSHTYKVSGVTAAFSQPV